MDCCASTSAVAASPPPAASSSPASSSSSSPPPSSESPAAAIAAAGRVPEPQNIAVSVVVRIRPMIARESGAAVAPASLLSVVSPTQLVVGEDPTGHSKADLASRSFAFDRVLGPESTQADAYEAVGRGVLLKVLEGFNGCVFAYGQTASGKTFTMEGSDSTNADANAPPPAPAAASAPRRASAVGDAASSAGVIPRLARDLCERLAASCAPGSGNSYTISAQYVEIYQEAIRDLLAAPRKGAAPAAPGAADGDGGAMIRQRLDGSVFLEGVNARVVHSAADILGLLAEGQARRTRGETNMNALSSRSHAVLTLSLSLMHEAAEGAKGKGDTLEKTCKIHLIDLAGSERADSTGATGARLKEGAKINLSLSALGGVISALTDPSRAHVPYRDSKLTRLLQDSLGGNSVTSMVCCVSLAASNFDETLASLRFAARAKLVKNVARVNVDAAAARIAALLDENRLLRARVAELEAAAQASAAAAAAPAPPAPAAAAPAGGGGCVIS